MKARFITVAAIVLASLSFTAPSLAFAQDAPAASSELNAIARAQTRLSELGLYNGEVTGRMNRATERAIDRFQSRNNLEPTGTLTPETLSLLFHE
jgi:peptidoglycan hydrolase-like protein with peptidoglycan-binding domain